MIAANERQFCFGRRLREKIIHARFRRNRRRRERIVARNHYRLDAHFAEMRETVFDAAFDNIFQVNHAQPLAILRDDERRAAIFCNALNGGVQFSWHIVSA